MKTANINDVRTELAGKTGLDPELEEMLFERITSIETDGGETAKLSKTDKTLITALVVVCIALMALCISWI